MMTKLRIRALKLQGVRYGIDHGYEEITTWNDSENLPMLKLNERLGFQRESAQITLVKKFECGDSLDSI